jgi:hypothetical protein
MLIPCRPEAAADGIPHMVILRAYKWYAQLG